MSGYVCALNKKEIGRLFLIPAFLLRALSPLQLHCLELSRKINVPPPPRSFLIFQCLLGLPHGRTAQGSGNFHGRGL